MSQAYTKSKILAEKELLKYNEMESSSGLEVVSLDCAEVAGETILPYVPVSTVVVVSPLLGDRQAFFGMKFLQDLLGLFPLVHVDDVCDALIFCAEKRSMKGRFLCSATGTSIREISAYFRENYPEWEIAEEWVVSAFWLQKIFMYPVILSILDMNIKTSLHFSETIEENYSEWEFEIFCHKFWDKNRMLQSSYQEQALSLLVSFSSAASCSRAS